MRVLTLVFSAVASTACCASRPARLLQRVVETTAVRAGNDAPSVELEARAGAESRHDRWAESEGRSDGNTAPDNSPASGSPPDAPAAAPARTAHEAEE